MLFLGRLNKIGLLAKKLISLITDYIFYNHWSGSSVFNPEHRVRCVIGPRARGVLVALVAQNSIPTMRCSISSSRAVRAYFQSAFDIRGYLLLQIVEMPRAIAIQFINASTVWCRVVLIAFLKVLVSLVLYHSTFSCRCIIIQTFVREEVVIVWMVS